MAISFYNDSEKSINLEEFISVTSEKIKFADEDSLLLCSDLLLSLAQNKTFFIDFLNNFLLFPNSVFENVYNEQSFLIYDCPNFYVRATYWPAKSDDSRTIDYLNKTFAYGFAHDHNFSLLTAGYKGEGYWTKLWEYDYEKVIGYPGEEVRLDFLEHTNLCEGKAIYYRPSKDVHLQLPPHAEDSLAINIILKSYKQFDNRQYEFDVENRKIANIIYGTASSKFGLLKLASLFGNSNTSDILLNISQNHKISQVRQEALSCLFQLENDYSIWNIGLNDKEKSVSSFSKYKLDNR